MVYRHECCCVITVERLDEGLPYLVIDFLMFFLLRCGEQGERKDEKGQEFHVGDVDTAG